MKGKLIDLSLGLNRKQRVTVEVDGDLRVDYDGLKDGAVDIAIKKYREKRSLDANAYCWVLIGKLAEVLRISPEEVYRWAIREIGGNYEIFPIRDDAVERWQQIWTSKGIGWICEIVGPSKLTGYTNTMNYFGSHIYDTRQMSALIDCIVTECKAQGIETKTPEELDRLKGLWGDG